MLHQPIIHLWENVPELVSEKNSANLEHLMFLLIRAGYAVSFAVLKSADFGHPTKRERVYGVCLNHKLLGMCWSVALKLANKIMDFVKASLKMDEPVPLERFLLAQDDPAVVAKLSQMEATKSANRESSGPSAKWRQKTVLVDSAPMPGSPHFVHERACTLMR